MYLYKYTSLNIPSSGDARAPIHSEEPTRPRGICLHLRCKWQISDMETWQGFVHTNLAVVPGNSSRRRLICLRRVAAGTGRLYRSTLRAMFNRGSSREPFDRSAGTGRSDDSPAFGEGTSREPLGRRGGINSKTTVTTVGAKVTRLGGASSDLMRPGVSSRRMSLQRQ